MIQRWGLLAVLIFNLALWALAIAAAITVYRYGAHVAHDLDGALNGAP